MKVARFIGNITLGLGGAFIVAASQGFSASVTGWLMFGVASGVVAYLAVAQLDRSRAVAQRAIDGVTGTLAAWSVVASLVFTGTVTTWLSFAQGIGFVTLAVAGLLTNELLATKALHGAGVTPIEAGRPAEELRPAA
jgi:hypothetical protein